jgi:hypothetical protein
MFWLGGLLALDVATSTPDALCPPLEEARAAIKARVGEVRGAYHVEFALVRAADGHQVLELEMREGQQKVLERELQLDETGCQNAAQTIALVLERYFDAVEKPATPPDLEPIPASARPPLSQNSPSPQARERPPADAPAPMQRPLRASAGFSYDLEFGLAPSLGAGWFPSAFQVAPRLQFGLMLAVSPFLKRRTERVRTEEISAFTVQGAFAVPLTWSFRQWSAAIGPWAQLRFQRADAPSLSHHRPAYRTVPGFGGLAQLGWSLRPAWSLNLGIALGAQAAGKSSRFVLRKADSETDLVLVPASTFGQAQLMLAVEL